MFDEYTEGFNAGFDFAHTGPALRKLETEAEERGFRKAVTDRDYLRIHRNRMEIILDQVEDQTFDVVLKAFSEFGLFNTDSGQGNNGGAIYEWLRVNRDRILANGYPVRIKAEGAE